MRFLTAVAAIQRNDQHITGSHRMKERPIGILAEALRELGADVQYQEKEGYPPLMVNRIFTQQTSSITVRGDISSQYISALLMIGPTLPKGLNLTLSGKIGSRPYIEMTIALMRLFGAEVSFTGNTLAVQPGSYHPVSYRVEADWSAASYWFAFAALAEEAEVLLPAVTLRSLQGDRVIVDMMEHLGVTCEPRGNHLLLLHRDHKTEFSWDFTHCPDLAQTVAVVCAAKGIEARFTGLESLRIKETDRIAALRQELQKLGAELIEDENGWNLKPAAALPPVIEPIHTYLDHRMAMAFAPLATLRNISIENPDVVKKSYPRFWSDVRTMGFTAT
jgi:3-phosphoshikimate 1-carboxyvinyltransferase